MATEACTLCSSIGDETVSHKNHILCKNCVDFLRVQNPTTDRRIHCFFCRADITSAVHGVPASTTEPIPQNVTDHTKRYLAKEALPHRPLTSEEIRKQNAALAEMLAILDEAEKLY